ncbi:MAG: hypothetical protein IPO93_04340, partial [Actinobacteria bacterium]|nr:hypothetical protein [Actinomycetota bacterium]
MYGRNGAGKSWILDCLYACLVGTRTRDRWSRTPGGMRMPALLVESALDRSEGLKAFFGANPDDRLEMF